MATALQEPWLASDSRSPADPLVGHCPASLPPGTQGVAGKVAASSLEMLSVLTGWMSTWLSMFLVCVIQTYSIVCHYFMGLLNAFGFTN